MGDSDNTEELLQNKESLFVLFYASWCPHSQRFLPIFKKYEKSHPHDCLSVMIDFKPALCDKYGIEYYPTVLLLKKGKIEKRLDATPGKGLTQEQFEELIKNP